MTQKTNTKAEQNIKNILSALFEFHAEVNDALYNKKISSQLYSAITVSVLDICELIDELDEVNVIDELDELEEVEQDATGG